MRFTTILAAFSAAGALVSACGSSSSTGTGGASSSSTTVSTTSSVSTSGGGSTSSSTGGGASSSSSGVGGSAGVTPAVFMILMENHNWGDIKGSKSGPYMNGTLLAMGAHAEQYFNPPGIHPSEPNYLWLEAGDNFGVTDDKDPSTNHQATTDHLAAYIEKAGLNWKSYQEDIDGKTCPLTGVKNYAPKHNPMIFFDDMTNKNDAMSAHCIQHVRPYTELEADLTADTVADYNFITPNLCSDGHNTCPPQNDQVKQMDDWLAAEVPKILASKAYKDRGVIVITWDESELGDFPIGMIILSKWAKPGFVSNTMYTHSSMLKTVQEMFGLTPLLRDAANPMTSDLSEFFSLFPKK